jgi:hypothetical protein
MVTVTIDLLTRKLKNAPQTVLERVNGYVDSFIEPLDFSKRLYKLTYEQQNVLDSQINSDKSGYVEAELLENELKQNYDL